MRILKILIIGSGVVGQATGIVLNQKTKHEFVFYDIDRKKVDFLRKKGYIATNNLKSLQLNNVLCSMICVPTPENNGKVDLKYIKRAVIDVAKYIIKRINNYHVVVIRSTILPSTIKLTLIPLLEKFSNKIVGKQFGICMNPEFLREKSALEDFQNPWRIVIGEYDKRSGDLLEKFYSNFDCPIIRTDLDSAAMIKYVSNAFLATKISFFNEIYFICKKLGLDEHSIAKVVALDPRIGSYGILGGTPFDGKCLPKDLNFFLTLAKSKNVETRLLNSVQEINRIMKEYERENKNVG